MRMTGYTEFAVGVTVWSLEKPDYQPCPELNSICDLLGANSLTRSPAELYPSSSPIRSVSPIDPESIMQIDIAGDPTDQMEIVQINIRCKSSVADEIETQLRQIRLRSEVQTALRRGDLGWNSGTEPQSQ